VSAFRAEARGLPDVLTLRDERPEDRGFLFDLFASIRGPETDLLPWNDVQKRAFLQQQFDLQWSQYRLHYAGAEWLIVEYDGAAAGRLYLEATSKELRIMDIALVPALRNRGIGTALIGSVLDHADRRALPASLHVEPFNPALRLYQRFGFQYQETRGIYCYMERPAQLKVIS
jgi:ribosomal protein S18 acetylase RimI-like enzyme